MSEVRTRIAPSPTGAPHIGTAYIALHNWAFAKSQGGKFILRIEDTDQARSTPESEKEILDSLKWLGLDWDEGPGTESDVGPFRQSERLDIYKKEVQKLLDNNKAYTCFCSKDRLTKLRAEQMAKKEDSRYDGFCRNLSPEEVSTKLQNKEDYVIRLKMPTEGRTSFMDEVRGEEISFDNKGIDDQILVKVDGFPTYHLASVVDDHHMRITHILRGEEWISSTPKHIQLYQAFGWKLPKFMHLPLLRNPDHSKISKRKNPTSISWFKAKGYHRNALLNFLALMGYSRADEKEIFSLEELVSDYQPSRLSTTAPVFDFKKLDRFNDHYLTNLTMPGFVDFQVGATQALLNYCKDLYPHISIRCKDRSGLEEWTAFLFEDEALFDANEFKNLKHEPQDLANTLTKTAKKLSKERLHDAEGFKNFLEKQAEEQGLSKNDLFMLIRLALMKRRKSLPLFEVMEFLASDLIIRKMKVCAQALKSFKRISSKKTPS